MVLLCPLRSPPPSYNPWREIALQFFFLEHPPNEAGETSDVFEHAGTFHSPGQKGLQKENVVFIVKTAGLVGIDGLELIPDIHIQMRI